MNKIEEKLESIEEVLQQLVHKITDLEKREIKFPEITLPDYTGWLKQIFVRVEALRKNPPAEVLKAMMQTLDQKIAGLPEQIPVRHHIETRSKGFLITGLLLILVSASSVGLFAHTWSVNRGLKENDLKYRMIRFQYPQAGLWADSIYQKDPKAARQITIELEREERALLKAEAEAKRREAAATEARMEADKLKER